MSAVPDRLLGFMAYEDGNKMIGIADITLPVLAYLTETLSGAGIAGEVDVPAKGLFGSLSTTINWRSLIQENIVYTAPRTYHFDFRGSVQIYDHDTGEFSSRKLKLVMRVPPKAITLGTLGNATPMGTSGEFELIYLNISIEGKEYIEIDKFAYICRVDGIDYLEKVRADLGMAN